MTEQRPEYARLLAEIAAGTVDTVVVWESSRAPDDEDVAGADLRGSK